MKVIAYVHELVDLGVWERVCFIKGLSMYEHEPEKLRTDANIYFTVDEARELCLI